MLKRKKIIVRPGPDNREETFLCQFGPVFIGEAPADGVFELPSLELLLGDVVRTAKLIMGEVAVFCDVAQHEGIILRAVEELDAAMDVVKGPLEMGFEGFFEKVEGLLMFGQINLASKLDMEVTRDVARSSAAAHFS